MSFLSSIASFLRDHIVGTVANFTLGLLGQKGANDRNEQQIAMSRKLLLLLSVVLLHHRVIFLLLVLCFLSLVLHNHLLLAYRDWETDRKSTRLNSSHITRSRMPSSA